MVQRIVPEPHIHMEWRRYQETPAGGVWSWTDDRALAFVFEHLEKPGDVFDAETHARALRDVEGDPMVRAVSIGGVDESVKIQRQLREGNRVDAFLSSVAESSAESPAPSRRAAAPKEKPKFLSRRPSKFKPRKSRKKTVSAQDCYERLERQHLA